MKIIFNKLVTTDATIKVSFDNGNTFREYTTEEALTNGIPFTEEDCVDISKIIIKGKLKTIKDIDTQKTISLSNSGIQVEYGKPIYEEQPLVYHAYIQDTSTQSKSSGNLSSPVFFTDINNITDLSSIYMSTQSGDVTENGLTPLQSMCTLALAALEFPTLDTPFIYFQDDGFHS